MKENVQEISLRDVCLDRETQIRATVSEETIQRYYDVMADEEGRDKFPPIKLFQDEEGNYWLADGHHRVMAAKRRKFTSILADVQNGTKADAIWEAAKANSRNGLQLGRADIRRAIVMILQACSDRSDQVIADAVGCSHMTVRRLRESESTLTNVKVETRIGKDGKRRPAARVKSETVLQCSDVPKSIDTDEPTIIETPLTKPQPEIPEPIESEPDPEKAILATEQEARIMETIDTLERQITEWFDVAPPEWIGEFEHRIQLRIRKLVE